MLSFLYLFIAGLLGGFIAGLVGIGGGIVYIFIIPLALRFLGVPSQEIVQYTIANSVFAILFASSSANYLLIRYKLFYRKEVILIGIGAIFASLFTLNFVVNTPWYSITVFNVIVIILLSYMLYSTLYSAKKVHITPPGSVKPGIMGSIGLAGGAISALSGMGGGIVIIPILNSFMRIDIKKASSISSGVIMVTSFVMTINNLLAQPMMAFRSYSLGYIIFPIALVLSAGVLIGSPFGVNFARNTKSTTISYIYATFLAIVIVKKLIELYLYSL